MLEILCCISLDIFDESNFVVFLTWFTLLFRISISISNAIDIQRSTEGSLGRHVAYLRALFFLRESVTV